jgi:glutamate 5-kinase
MSTGFYTANPNLDPTARRFDTVDRITPEIEAMAGDGISGVSKGGMITKIMAATRGRRRRLRHGDHGLGSTLNP